MNVKKIVINQAKTSWEKLADSSLFRVGKARTKKHNWAVKKIPPCPYELLETRKDADVIFLRLRQYFYEKFAQERDINTPPLMEAPQLFWEAGRIDPGRLYFYLKKPNEIGWLFERSGLGWAVTQCEKIVDQDLFLRRHEPWDIVSLYSNGQHPPHIRVSSLLAPGELMSFLLYQKLIYQEVME